MNNSGQQWIDVELHEVGLREPITARPRVADLARATRDVTEIAKCLAVGSTPQEPSLFADSCKQVPQFCRGKYWSKLRPETKSPAVLAYSSAQIFRLAPSNQLPNQLEK